LEGLEREKQERNLRQKREKKAIEEMREREEKDWKEREEEQKRARKKYINLSLGLFPNKDLYIREQWQKQQGEERMITNE